jgi:hypothetical protein
MNQLRPTIAALALSLCTFHTANAQFVVNDSLTVEELILDFFDSGILVELSNLTVNGQSPDIVNNQFALFDNGLTDGIEMNTGLVMATTTAEVFLDPTSLAFDFLTNPVVNDPDMMMLTGQNVNDCAIIEFDVQVDADALAFQYIFASSEYAGFTCTIFNDGFGFFISGPGIEGPYSNNAKNIATIPDSDTPVSINTVNGGSSTGSGSSAICEAANPNWQDDTIYFVNNANNANSGMMANGYTVTLEAYVEIEFGETYHMKLAVCDALDIALDSGVFFEEGSFEGRLLGPTNTNESTGAKMAVYPNPSHEILTIDPGCATCSGMIDVRIKDIHGRDFKSARIDARTKAQLSVQDIAPGLYLIELRDGENLLGVSKFVRSLN